MLGIADAVRYCLTENYANVFYINPVDGKWVVSRTSSGTLYMDDSDNYSSNKYGGIIETPVPNGFVKDHKHTLAYKPKYSSYGGYWDDDDYWNRGKQNRYYQSSFNQTTPSKGCNYHQHNHQATSHQTKWDKKNEKKNRKYASIFNQHQKTSTEDRVLDEERKNTNDWKAFYKKHPEKLAQDLFAGFFDNMDELLDLVVDMEWHKEKVPNHVYKILKHNQRKWIKDLRKDLNVEHLSEEEEELNRRTSVVVM
jgi:hypothetical protein